MKNTLTIIILFLSSFIGYSQENKSKLQLADGYHDQAVNILTNNGDLNKALDYINKAILNNPKNANGFYIKGNIIERTNGFASALQIYLKVLTINPKHIDATSKVAVCYGKLNNKTKFCIYAKKACDLGSIEACNMTERFCN